jgi:hypothetical protein
MTTRLSISIFVAALIASAGLTSAQDKGTGKQPPAEQSAPSESSDAPGHDAQAGRPETGEKRTGQTGAEKTTNAKKKMPGEASPK